VIKALTWRHPSDRSFFHVYSGRLCARGVLWSQRTGSALDGQAGLNSTSGHGCAWHSCPFPVELRWSHQSGASGWSARVSRGIGCPTWRVRVLLTTTGTAGRTDERDVDRVFTRTDKIVYIARPSVEHHLQRCGSFSLGLAVGVGFLAG
jgi:hypothetical protein